MGLGKTPSIITPDNYKPGANLQTLQLRAGLLAATREFFAERNILEVDTPALSSAGVSDPNIHSFTTRFHGPGPLYGRPLYLHTSPELPMKRLLAAGSGSIYQIAKVFRDGESGSWHNPEFTLLEWYRVDFDHHQLIDEIDLLIRKLLKSYINLDVTEKRSYREMFLRYLKIDPHQTSVSELHACAVQQGIDIPNTMPQNTLDPWLDILLSHCIEPHLGKQCPTFIYDYPATQAALAKIRPDKPPLAERFELYINGVELANGFHELNDADEQRRRFEADNEKRRERGLPVIPLDERFLAALSDLPPCAGVALGIDRLLMLAAGKTSIDEVIAFSGMRA